MRKMLIAASLFFAVEGNSQTLFTYGKDSVNIKEFLQAYQKNNSGKKDPKILQEYLNLYIASRLKVKEARERGYDTLPQLLADIANLREQILPAYERDTETLNKLVEEAFNRSQKDIRLAHIFISAVNEDGQADVEAARKKANEAYSLLNKMPFEEVARKYSDDPSAKVNGGHIGFITVFDLPYELETLAYNTQSGKVSGLHQSKGGFHIFKNIEERPAVGRMKAAQILLAFPPDSDEAYKQKLKSLADSLYTQLQKGSDFGKLAAQFSNDAVSAAANGLIPEFGIGQYDPLFEQTVFGLKDGGISKPFLTEHGYHIVKRLARVPVATNKSEALLQALKERIEQNDRINITKDALAKKVWEQTKPNPTFKRAELWAYSDSVFDSKKPPMQIQLNAGSPLFLIGMKTTSVSDWINYAQIARYKQDGSGIKPYDQIWNEFTRDIALSYYKENLEQFNSDFRNQMNEFKEGNLFFEIMQKEIWGPAQTDTAALKSYFEKNKKRYVWKESVNAVLFYASDEATAKTFITELKKAPQKWKELVEKQNERVTADEGRFEVEQLSNSGKALAVKAGMITPLQVNSNDNTASFAYIKSVYKKSEPRSFEEAKGLVINDYQTELEQQWIESLKKKYPVTINQAAWQSVLNTR